MKIAVTSASGQLGSTIVQQLMKTVGKDQVVGVARTPAKATHLGIEIRKGDYNNYEDFLKAFKDIDKVLLVSGMDKPENRIRQHRNVIQAAKDSGVQKIVYTSIVGDEQESAFSPIVRSNRQTEKDIQASGLQWVIGRNGIYIEPDLEYLDHYIKDGEIRNSAGAGRCAYTSREELSVAYTQMLLDERHNGQIYNLVGHPITQSTLADTINKVYGTDLSYKTVSISEYVEERKKALGEFLGTIIGGIYESMHKGVYDLPSDFEKIVGRPHQSTIDLVRNYRNSHAD